MNISMESPRSTRPRLARPMRLPAGPTARHRSVGAQASGCHFLLPDSVQIGRAHGRRAGSPSAVQRPAGAVGTLEIVVRFRGIDDAAAGGVVFESLAGAVRHEAEEHLLDHRTGVVEVAVGLGTGAVGYAVVLAFTGF